MKSRIQRIDIQNFKAFRKFSLNVEGRHLLIYGGNGSGKSSLYWALYTFLQSAGKPMGGITKYFDPANNQCLLNIHEQAVAQPQPGEVAITLRDRSTGNDSTFRIGKDIHGTRNQPLIKKGDLASDFVTYRFFFGFSHFRNSETFDLWPLFEKEILPFCVTTSGHDPQKAWDAIKSGAPNSTYARGRGGRSNYEKFAEATKLFAQILPGIIDSISAQAQKFYDKHFADGDAEPITLRLALTTVPSFSGTNQNNCIFKTPVLQLGVQIGDKKISRPQTFLNEAKLTQLALSVRFAASEVNLHESDLKLLVLDDLLVSLDMSNRMRVVEILLSDAFKDYQKFILTHDLGFFHEFRRATIPNQSDWCFVRLTGDPSTEISCRNEKTELQKAEEYIHGYNLDEAAICLRRAAEGTAKRYREWRTCVLRAISCSKKFRHNYMKEFSTGHLSPNGSTLCRTGMLTWIPCKASM
jgi:energy-coupling factor transporter ATP-binding protein EcfA2